MIYIDLIAFTYLLLSWPQCPTLHHQPDHPAATPLQSQSPAYSSRFHITNPDITPSRCCCQVYTPTEPPSSIQDTFRKGTFLHIYWKYRRIAVDFIYIYSSKNTIFHKNAYNTVYIEKTYIYKNSHFFNYYKKTHIYKKHHFVKIRVFFTNNNYFYIPVF